MPVDESTDLCPECLGAGFIASRNFHRCRYQIKTWDRNSVTVVVSFGPRQVSTGHHRKEISRRWPEEDFKIQNPSWSGTGGKFVSIRMNTRTEGGRDHESASGSLRRPCRYAKSRSSKRSIFGRLTKVSLRQGRQRPSRVLWRTFI